MSIYVICRILGYVMVGLALMWAAISDYRTRTIPNMVSIVILAAGFLTGYGIVYRAISLGVVVITLVIAYFLLHMHHGGGDVKVILALSISIGGILTMLTIGACAIIATAYGIVTKKPLNRKIPLGTYMFFSYCIVTPICALLL